MSQVMLSEVPDVLGDAFAAGDPAYGSKAEERENVRSLARIFACIASGRFDDFASCLAPDATLEIVAPPGVPWIRTARGAEEVAAAVAANFRTVRDQRPEVLSLVAQGDTVMVMGRERGCLAETGEPYEVLLTQQFTFREGRLAAFRSVAGTIAAERSSATPVVHGVFPYLCVRGAAEAIAFYTRVFGARETMRIEGGDGRIGHAELELGPALLMLADEFPEAGVRSPLAFGGTGLTLHLHVDDVDTLAARAVEAGATMVREPADHDYGERQARVRDPFGHEWLLGHPIPVPGAG